MNNFIQNIAVLLTRNELICNKLPIIIKETGQKYHWHKLEDKSCGKIKRKLCITKQTGLVASNTILSVS